MGRRAKYENAHSTQHTIIEQYQNLPSHMCDLLGGAADDGEEVSEQPLESSLITDLTTKYFRNLSQTMPDCFM